MINDKHISVTFYFSLIVGTFEVNYMDDVGQTLLNWASAFGTLEMVSIEICWFNMYFDQCLTVIFIYMMFA